MVFVGLVGHIEKNESLDGDLAGQPSFAFEL